MKDQTLEEIKLNAIKAEIKQRLETSGKAIQLSEKDLEELASKVDSLADIGKHLDHLLSSHQVTGASDDLTSKKENIISDISSDGDYAKYDLPFLESLPVFKFALTGMDSKVDELIKGSVQNASAAVVAYSRENRFDRVEIIIKKQASPQDLSIVLGCAIAATARNGSLERTVDFFHQLEDKKLATQRVIEGCRDSRRECDEDGLNKLRYFALCANILDDKAPLRANERTFLLSCLEDRALFFKDGIPQDAQFLFQTPRRVENPENKDKPKFFSVGEIKQIHETTKALEKGDLSLEELKANRGHPIFQLMDEKELETIVKSNQKVQPVKPDAQEERLNNLKEFLGPQKGEEGKLGELAKATDEVIDILKNLKLEVKKEKEVTKGKGEEKDEKEGQKSPGEELIQRTLSTLEKITEGPAQEEEKSKEKSTEEEAKEQERKEKDAKIGEKGDAGGQENKAEEDKKALEPQTKQEEEAKKKAEEKEQEKQKEKEEKKLEKALEETRQAIEETQQHARLQKLERIKSQDEEKDPNELGDNITKAMDAMLGTIEKHLPAREISSNQILSQISKGKKEKEEKAVEKSNVESKEEDKLKSVMKEMGGLFRKIKIEEAGSETKEATQAGKDSKGPQEHGV